MPSKTQDFIAPPLPPDLYLESQASEYGLTEEAFRALLVETTVKHTETLPHASPRHVLDLWRSLNVGDLALAQGCALGNDRAWVVFFERYRLKLYHAGLSLTHDEGRARELAETFCSDLYPSSERKKSRLASFSGRGSLLAWLKIALMQANVDVYRAERRRRSVDLEEIASSLGYSPVLTVESSGKEFRDSLREGLRELKPEGRFLLVAHFLDRRSLADISLSLRVHESTVSRRLRKAIKTARKNVDRSLRQRGIHRTTLHDSIAKEATDPSLDLRTELLFGIEMAGHQS
jgi:RNA polymerase sigma-70 factor, ECF subfamily